MTEINHNTNRADLQELNPKISVIIPARNEEKYIYSCIKSVLSQNFTDYEIIIVDNGSTDLTAKIAEESGCKVVYEPCIGLPQARERGRSVAKGELLVYIDADTVIPPDYLSHLYRYIQENEDISAASNPFIFYDSNKVINTLALIYFKFILPIYHRIPETLRISNVLFGGNFAVKSDVLQKINGFDTGIDFNGEDVHLSKRISLIGKIGFIHNLFTMTSARRFQREGFLRTFVTYLINLISILHFNKSVNLPVFNYIRIMKYSLSVLFFAVFIYAFTYPKSEIFGRVYYRLDSNEKKVALTFDDGPNGNSTIRILNILDREHVKGTFFLIGKNVERYPDIAKEIIRRGHIIGNHSYTHAWKIPFDNKKMLDYEIDKTEETIFNTTGIKPNLFRPPHGLRTPWMISVISKKGYKIITWDDMTNDYINTAKSSDISRKIISRARPGSIIALHDGLNLAHGIDRRNAAEALISIIKELKKMGYTFTTIE